MSQQSSVEWTENRATAGRRALDLAELWAYRELVLFLALRDLKVRYRQAVFGVAWAIFQPLAGLAVAIVVFHNLADIPSDRLPYPVFAFLGFTVWSYFSSSLDGATASLVGNASLVTKIYFPRMVAPIAAVLPRLVDTAIAFLLLGGLMAWYGVTPGPALLLLPVWFAALVLLAFGAGLVLATLNVTYRDVANAIGLLTQLWLFASPVVYPSSLVPGRWRLLYAVNPMVGILDGFRWSVLGAPRPPAVDAVSALTLLVILVAGIRYFQRCERRFADVI
ncbi:MAG: ABC transporter permease [Actinomycetota bacterium]|nr:ABC transporter permease [Actinomycetota bacterium]